MSLQVRSINAAIARAIVTERHYLHRAPPVSFAFGLFSATGDEDSMALGVCVFGKPASHHLCLGVCPSNPGHVIELNRLWVDEVCPRNTESWFVSRCLSALPAKIVVSYADTAAGHAGYVYRALNFNYAGWTDMDRKTPRFDYVTPGKHSRAAFRAGGGGASSERVRRQPKHRYWIVTGNRREQRDTRRLVAWPSLSWRDIAP